MNKKGKDIEDELKEIIPGLNLPSAAPPYGVPAGYFENLPEQVLQRIRMENADTAQEELATLSPLLAAAHSASRQQPHSVPAGYFNELPARIMAGIQTQPRVIPMHSRRRYLTWAVAACLTGCIGLSALFLLRNNKSNNSLEAQLASISDQEIVDYLQTHSDAFDNDAIFSNVSNVEVADDLPAEAIEKYLESSGWSN